MRRAQSTGSPSRTSHGACFGMVALPVFLVLGPHDSLSFGQDEPTNAPTEQGEETESAPAVDGAEIPATIPEANAAPPGPSNRETESPGYASAGSPSSVSGYVNLRTRSRWAADLDEDDHDLFAVVSTDVYTGGENNWGIHFMGRAQLGLIKQDPDSIFYGVQDTYSDSLMADIYHLYVDVPVSGALDLFRVGRMVIYPTPRNAYFDGIQLETTAEGPIELAFGGYGGNSVHLYEGWPSEEWMGGLYTSFKPWEKGKLRVDWMRLDDAVRTDERVIDLMSFDLDHNFTRNLNVDAEFTLLNGSRNDARLSGFWSLPEQDMTIRASFFRLLNEQTDFAYELNPYFNSLRTYKPYNQGQLVVSKTFDDKWQLYGGFDARRVENQEDIGTYNRDFDRYYVTGAAIDLLPLQTTVSLTSDFWDSPDNDQQTWSLDFTSQFNEVSKASIGTYYSLYKYYLDSNAESEDVRTYYAEYKRDVSDSTRVMARYEYEHQEIDSFHNLRLGLSWRF